MSRQSITKGSAHDALSQSKSHEVDMPRSRGVHPEVSEESDLRGVGRDLGEVLRTSCPRWAATNKRFERISGSRNRKNVGKHNSGWIPVATFRWRK